MIFYSASEILIVCSLGYASRNYLDCEWFYTLYDFIHYIYNKNCVLILDHMYRTGAAIFNDKENIDNDDDGNIIQDLDLFLTITIYFFR